MLFNSSSLTKYVHSSTGRLVISALLGVGLASIFREVCKERHCMVHVGPTAADLTQTYRWDGRCYKLRGEAVSCMPDKTILDFSH